MHVHCSITVVLQYWIVECILALFPGVEEEEERAPVTHCLHMCVVIAKTMWQN